MKHRQGIWVPKTSARENAGRELPLFAAEYFLSGRKAARKGVSARRLHEFRLATKHFRYLLELFRPLYGSQFDLFFQQLRSVQTVLGELNDYAVTRALVLSEEPKPAKETRPLFDYLDSHQKKKTAAFRRFWKDEFDSEGAEERWKDYLARPETPRKRTSK
ncbi:MAG: CHAD domain-containing protein [Acidobacteria bacterium]|nr:CHAD domain-containing protein [Acidobacteriota bacterium]